MAKGNKQLKYYKFDGKSTQFFKGYKAPFGLDGKLPQNIEIEPLPDVCKPKVPEKTKTSENPFDNENMNPIDMFKSLDGVMSSGQEKTFDDPYGWKGIDKENSKKKFTIEVLDEKIDYEALIYTEEEKPDGTYIFILKLDDIAGMKEINLDIRKDKVKITKKSDDSIVFDWDLKS